METPWLVIYVASRQEKKIAHLLERNQIPFYLPLYKKLRQWSDRKKWVEFPLFNGYIFVQPDEYQRDAVLTLNGVVGYLKYNGKDAIVRQNEIATIKRLLETGYALETELSLDDVEIGETLVINEGPLQGTEVQLMRKDGETQALVSFENSGISIKVDVPVQILQKVKQSNS
jgi:transcription antitermination factor NusG